MIKLIYNLGILLLFSMSACGQDSPQKDEKMNTIKIANPLLCDPASGICEIPNSTYSPLKNTAPNTNTKPLKIIYFTDPICSSCWGIEPQLKKMKLEYGDHIEIEYRMGGLLKDWSYNSGGISKPSDVAHHWDEVSAYYEMPIDGDVWLEDPLDSSYPPSIAFKAAQMQEDEVKALNFMRILREFVFLEKKNITNWEHIHAAAIAVGLDTQKLKEDFEGLAKEHFQADLDLAKKMGVRGFPTLFFIDLDNKQQILYGAKPYANFETTINKALPNMEKSSYPITPKFLFDKFATLTTKEFAVLSGVGLERANKLLSQLFDDKLLQKTVTKNGVLWIGKSTRF